MEAGGVDAIPLDLLRNQRLCRAAPADNYRDTELVRLFQNSRYYPSLRPDPKPGQVALFPIPASETSANPLIK